MNRIRTWLALALLLLMHGATAFNGVAADFLVRNWRNEEGMPHSIINSIVQSRDGYLWIGTYVGLVRFDGIRFVQYASSTVPELESGRINLLFEDRSGTLWVSLESGRLLAWKDGRARVHLPGGAAAPVVAMAEQRSGAIWAQTADGRLGRLNTSGFELVSDHGLGLNRKNLGLVVDGQDRVWVGTRNGAAILEDGQLNIPESLNGIGSGPVDSLFPGQDGSVWIHRQRRLWKIVNGAVARTLEIPSRIGNIPEVLEASDGRLWLGAADGKLFCLEGSDDWREIPESGMQGLNRVLVEDREGNIWRGGFGGGLTQIRSRVFTVHELADTGLDRYARTVCSDSAGNIWAVLNGQFFSHLPAGQVTPQALPRGTPHLIKSLFIDSRNVLWCGTDAGYLHRLQNGSLVEVLKVGERIEFISALYEDPDGNVWVGFSGGAGVGFMRGGDPAQFQLLEGIPYPDVRAIVRAPDGAMWFGTHYGGVIRLKDGQWTQWTLRDGLPSDYVRCLLADPDGTIWLGTLHGICRWRDGRWSAITAENGLWNESISHMADDGRGQLWVSSFGGVFRVGRDELEACADGRSSTVHCVGYDRNDGLPNVECSGGFQPAGATTPDGRLWFPTVGGLVSVAPGELQVNHVPPPVWIETVAIDGVAHSARTENREIEVAPGGRRLEFRFTALSFVSSEKVRFRYRLAGLEDDWSASTAARSATYSFLPPGRYRFEVIACNNDGIWNEQGHSIGVVVLPFFWQTWWFRFGTGLTLAVVLALAGWQVGRWRARNRLRRLEQQHAIERERSRIAKDIHDDLGANLSQIVFLSQRVEVGLGEQAGDLKRWVSRIPATASRTIQSLDEIVWAINPRHDSLESLANYLSRFAQEFLGLAEIRCQLDIPTVLPPVPLGAEVRHNLVLTAREALQNVATHSRAREAWVRLQLDDRELVIEIADNGEGFDPGRVSAEGNGLSNMRRRLEDIGGVLQVETRPRGGTVVRCIVAHANLQGRVRQREQT